MAYEEALQPITLESQADYSDASARYRFVVASGNRGFLRASAIGADAVGVCQDDPRSSEASCIAIGGVTKIVAGAAFAAGAQIASDAQGRAVTASSGNFILGTALSAAASAGIIIPLHFEKAGKL